jgi:hypothetical protein
MVEVEVGYCEETEIMRLDIRLYPVNRSCRYGVCLGEGNEEAEGWPFYMLYEDDFCLVSKPSRLEVGYKASVKGISHWKDGLVVGLVASLQHLASDSRCESSTSASSRVHCNRYIFDARPEGYAMREARHCILT